LVRARDCHSRIRRCDSGKTPNEPSTQIYMDLSYISDVSYTKPSFLRRPRQHNTVLCNETGQRQLYASGLSARTGTTKPTITHWIQNTLFQDSARFSSTRELEDVILQWESVQCYTVSWHFLTLTFAHGAPHPVPHNCNKRSKVVFSTNRKSLCYTNQDTYKTKLPHTNLRGAWILLRVCLPTMVPVALATGATNGNSPPILLVRRKLPQNHTTV